MSKRIKDPIPPYYTVLPREIRDATKWALRAARIPAGYSPMAEHLVSQTTDGLSILARDLAQLANRPIQRPQLSEQSETELIIDVQGEHLLLVGPAVLDLTIARTAQHRRCLTRITHLGAGTEFLEALLIYHASRGHQLLLIGSSSSSSSDGQNEHIFWPTPTPQATHSTPVPPTLNRGRYAPAETADPIASWLPLTENSALIYSYAADHAPDLAQGITTQEQTSSDRLQAQHDEAEANGIQVEGHIWQAVKSFGNQILIEK